MTGNRRMERHYGSFESEITLPVLLDLENAEAEYKKGLLEIHLRKKSGLIYCVKSK